MKQSPHILFITPGFAANNDDLNCIPPLQVYLLALLKKYPGITVTVLSLHYPHKKSRYRWHGTDVFCCGGANRNFPARLATWAAAFKAVSAINRKRPINIIHSFWGKECAFIGQQVARWIQKPQVITFMGQESEQNSYYRFINFKKTFTICLSGFHRERFISNFSLKPDEVIPWGAVEEDFPPEASERDIDILGVGSLIPLKNFTEFPLLIKRLMKDNPKVKAVLVGEGEEHQKIEKGIKEFGLKANLELAGHILRPQVLQLMARSKILFHPSVFESQGYVFSEAAMSGCAIVSRKVGIAHESGNWTIAADTDAQYEAVKKLLSVKNYTKRNLHSIDETVEAYRNVYEKCSGNFMR